MSGGVLELPVPREGRTGESRGLVVSGKGLGRGSGDGPGALMSIWKDGT
jgi:hypothetical protein